MGRYDFRPARVARTASQLLDTKLISMTPLWTDIMREIPPSSTQTLVRPVKKRRKSKMFQPLPMNYEEDRLRLEFYGDHPWELARPKIVVESTGNDARDWDWSTGIRQPGKPLDGESVIQRQLHLMRNSNLPKSQAYDLARKEFYKLRMYEDVERRVAKEEALAAGAYFGPGPNAVSMELENKVYEDWKVWALAQAQRREQIAASGYTSTEEESDMSLSAGEEEGALEELGDKVPGSREGQRALGGAATRPAQSNALPSREAGGNFPGV